MKKIYFILLLISLLIFIFYCYPTPRHSINELYTGSDKAKIAALDSLRTVPLKSISINGQEWNYLTIGNGSENILFLHGMAGSYDIWWQQIQALKNNYKVISITYPPINTLKGLGEAVIRILDAEHIERTHVIGSSLGGYVAQYLKTTYPNRFKKAIFGNTFPPNDIYKEKNSITATLARFLPEWLVMYAFRSTLKEKVLPASENSPLAEAYLLEQSYGGMSKQQFLARYQCVVDTFTPGLSVISSKDILIIESDNDPLVFPELRQRMKEIYPAAEVFTFHGKGHFPYLNETIQYDSLMRAFFGRP